MRCNRFDEAMAQIRSVIADDPANPYAHNLLGLLLKQQGNLPAAAESLRRAIALDAQQPGFHSNLGGVLLAMGDFTGAKQAYGAAAGLQPASVEAIFNHGIAHLNLGQFAPAETLFRRAVELQPDFVPGWVSLSATMIGLRQFTAAIQAAERALTADPARAEAWINLGYAQLELGNLPAAEQSSRRALEFAPGQAQAAYNLGVSLQYQWRCREAAEAYDCATGMDPSHQRAWSNRLLVALYDPDETEESIFARSRRWAQLPVNRLPVAGSPHPQPHADDADRRLRIGYVSPDFRNHSCASFLKPLFAAHDSRAVEIIVYATTGKEDETTHWFRAHVDHWRDISALTDAAAAELIRQDRLDILVDLAGHTMGNAIGIFLRKPAPIQVSWLGYPATTGVEQIDYRLTDAVADPAGEADDWHVERLIRLDDGFLCYAPRRDTPDVGALPAEANGFVTFGSCNNIAKLTPAAVVTWSRILAAVPRSRLILKGWMLGFAATRARIESAFVAQGIEPRRLDLRGWTHSDRYLELYQQIDIGLDTFPYNGTTTTFESLWMGVPVITLSGSRHAGRVGAAILTRLGSEDWIARDEDGYVAAARRLSGNIGQLAEIRAGLRPRLARSSLCDGPGFARKFEGVLRRIWHEHVARCAGLAGN